MQELLSLNPNAKLTYTRRKSMQAKSDSVFEYWLDFLGAKSPPLPNEEVLEEYQRLAPTHHLFLSMIEKSQTAPAPVHADQVEEVAAPVYEEVIQNLITLWAETAVSHATARNVSDPPGFVATVAGIEGAWGFGQTRKEAIVELKSVLEDWADLKLQDRDEDIPSMEGIHLVIKR